MAARILVADDDADIREVLRIGLEREGYEILEASDGLATLNTARQQKPDLIVLDIMMPRLNGYEVARMLKFDRKFRSIPILMLTANRAPEERDLGTHTGADCYMTKPFTFAEILPSIRELLCSAEPGR